MIILQNERISEMRVNNLLYNNKIYNGQKVQKKQSNHSFQGAITESSLMQFAFPQKFIELSNDEALILTKNLRDEWLKSGNNIDLLLGICSTVKTYSNNFKKLFIFPPGGKPLYNLTVAINNNDIKHKNYAALNNIAEGLFDDAIKISPEEVIKYPVEENIQKERFFVEDINDLIEETKTISDCNATKAFLSGLKHPENQIKFFLSRLDSKLNSLKALLEFNNLFRS